jgi:hypothetical protein
MNRKTHARKTWLMLAIVGNSLWIAMGRRLFLVASGVVLGLSLMLGAALTDTSAFAAGTVTDCTMFGPGPGTLSDALAGGGTVTFACDGTIIVPEIVINTSTVIDATGQSVTLSGNNTNRVLTLDDRQVDPATVELRNLTITQGNGVGGVVSPAGGGILSTGTLTLRNSTVSGNSVAGQAGIQNFGTMTIIDSTVSGNSGSTGGGILNGIDTLLTITNSTVSGNTAFSLGGGIGNSGTMTIANSTVSGNTGSNGGGISNSQTTGIMTITNSTVSGNTSTLGVVGGITSQRSGVVTLANTIVAHQAAGGDCETRTGGVVISNGHNLDSEGSCLTNPTTGDMPNNPNANLGPLQDNGGPTETHALLLGSDAIDMGDDLVCAGPNVNGVDQRGFSRTAGGQCDIGAIEFVDCDDNGVDDGTQIAIDPSLDQDGNGLLDACEVLIVDLDIKPGNHQNAINPRENGGIWVAILSDTRHESPFDPSSEVDIPSVEFGPDGAMVVRQKVKDINKDGLGDLLLRFKNPAIGIACGDAEATLTGETLDGQSITGTDIIKTVGCYN